MAYNGMNLSILDKIRKTDAWKKKDQEYLDSMNSMIGIGNRQMFTPTQRGYRGKGKAKNIKPI